MRRFSFGTAACAIALLAVSASAQETRARAGAPKAGADSGFYRASEILGTTVRGSDGQELGKIQDLLIERRNQQIRYFILGEGETLEAQASVHVLPWMAARPVFEGDQRFVDVRIERTRFEQAPTFTWQEVQAGPGAWSTEVDQFFQVRGTSRRGSGIDVEREGGLEVEGEARPGAARPRRGDAARDRETEDAPEGAARPRAGTGRSGRAADRAADRATDRPETAEDRPEAADAPATDAPETDAPERELPETPAPETDAPEVEADTESGEITIEPKN